ncbi:MAG: hypothetical protein DRI57_25375 [Deltaproteobacteria bacterium]|nr:MAG: hypothetical protein DRI57_25375 [Deltaproteobacteria bacterium]
MNETVKKCQIEFSPELGLSADDLKEFVEKWNSDENCKTQARAELEEMPAETFVYIPNELAVVVLTGIGTGVAANMVTYFIREKLLEQQRRVPFNLEFQRIELPEKESILIKARKALSGGKE